MEYLKKNMWLKWFFCLQINMKVSYKVIVFLMCVTRLAQSIQNNKFAIYLQYLKEIGKNEFDFFLSAIWLSHDQLWAILKGTASLTRR